MNQLPLRVHGSLAPVVLIALGSIALSPGSAGAQSVDPLISTPAPIERPADADDPRQRCPASVRASNTGNETLWCDLLVDELNRNTQRTPEDNLALVSAYHNRASVLIRAAQFEQADADLAEALRLDPNHHALHVTLGNLRFAEQRFEEALRSYNQAITASNGAVPGYYINRALALRGLGQLELALEDVLRARNQMTGERLSPNGTGEVHEDEFP